MAEVLETREHKLDSNVWRVWLKKTLTLTEEGRLTFLQTNTIGASLILSFWNLQLVGLLPVKITISTLKSYFHKTAYDSLFSVIALQPPLIESRAYFLFGITIINLFVIIGLLAGQFALRYRRMVSLLRLLTTLLMLYLTIHVFAIVTPGIIHSTTIIAQSASETNYLSLMAALLYLIHLPLVIVTFKSFNLDFRYHSRSLITLVVRLSFLTSEPQSSANHDNSVLLVGSTPRLLHREEQL